MPGVIMDNANAGILAQKSSVHDVSNGARSPSRGVEQQAASSDDHRNGLIRVNGTTKQADNAPRAFDRQNVPELAHITHGLFPFAQLVNRMVQQCWNDLCDVVTELAEVQVPAHDETPQSALVTGKAAGNQSSENTHKKLRLLEFAHAKRAEFIKLLVLSQWSRQAADVSKLIDLQAFIRNRHQAYSSAIQSVGDMKRDLVQAQVANPDLTTALEVLSKGKVSAIPDLGYKPPKPLSARKALKKLRKINRIITTRLTLHDVVPTSLRNYHVHDGRVTFVVPGEFELDLSIGEENFSSQFYFIDIRFLFSPSSPIPKGRIRNELDLKLNEILLQRGLTGCFEFMHSLVLTNKVNVLFKQAIELARGLWSDALRVELLHRTLVVQYWTARQGPKSWVEIGINSGRHMSQHDSHRDAVPFLSVRWMRDGKQVDPEDIYFDTESLSMERMLRSVIALHTTHILSSVYQKLSQGGLYSIGTLALRAQLSRLEPGDCHLDVQLTGSRDLRVSIEPISGASVLTATPAALDRTDSDRGVDELINRVSRFRCIAAMEEVESKARILGFEIVNPRSLRLDLRRMFPTNVLRFSFFSHRAWERDWIVAATSSMDGDHWWVVQLRPAVLSIKRPVPGTKPETQNQVTQFSAQMVSKAFFPRRQEDQGSFTGLGHCLAGILAMHSNARYLADSQCASFRPSLQSLQLGGKFEMPTLVVRYDSAKLPAALRMDLPPGITRKSLSKDAISLVFHGVDHLQGKGIIVAYGSLKVPIKNLEGLVSKGDEALIFRKGGKDFAIRLLAPPGQSIIIALFERLQRLECMLSILECLQSRKTCIQAFSLSEVIFKYSTAPVLSAKISLRVPDGHSAAELSPAEVMSKRESFLPASLAISFDHPNPHRRIQASLTAALNYGSLGGGLNFVVGLLFVTLPALQALDTITANPTRDEPLKTQVVVRSAKAYLIRYPKHKYTFLLRIDKHADRMVWVLRDVSGNEDRSKQTHIVSALQEQLYNARGEGWQGLGTGVVAYDADKVGSVVLQLAACFDADAATTAIATTTEDPDKKASASASASANPSTVKREINGNDNNTNNPSGSGQGVSAPTKSKQPSSKSSNAKVAFHNQDVIMID